MSNLFTQVFSGWTKHTSRFVLAILGIAAGVFCLGTLVGMLDIQGSQMDKAHIASHPANLVLILRNPAPQEILPKLKAMSGIADIDVQSQTTVRYRKTGETLWSLATILTRPDYTRQNFDRINLDEGHWPGQDEFAIEGMSSSYFAVPLETRLQFQSRDGLRDMNIGGIIRHPFTKPPRFGGQALFLASPDTGALFGLEIDHFNQLLIRTINPSDLEQTRHLAAELRIKLAGLGYPVSATLLKDTDKHWGHVFFAGVNKVLFLMAWASLLLASMLIFNSVAAHMSEQAVQIAIMKAIGASLRIIFSLYIVEIILLSLIAIAVAIPAAVALAHAGSRWMLSLFNIAPSGLLYSVRAMSSMAMSGMGVSVLAAFLPILKAVNQPVRKGLDTQGIGNDFGINLFDRLLERYVLQSLPTLFATAIANIFRKKGRFLWIQGSLLTAGVIFLVILSLRASVDLTLDNELQRTRYSVRLGLMRDYPQQELQELAQASTDTISTEFWRRLPLEIADKSGKAIKPKGSLGLQLLALPASSRQFEPYITSGRWLAPSDAGQKVLVISADTAELNHLEINDEVTVNVANQQASWRIIGVYRWLAGTNFVIEPAYAALETVEAIVPQKNMASFVVTSTQIRNLEKERDYLKSLQDQFWDHGIQPDIFSTTAKLDQREHAKQQLLPVTGMLFGLATMVAVIAGTTLAGALTLNVLQRKREIGVLRSIGANNRHIVGLFMTEGIIHGILAWLGSTALALVCARPASALLGQTMFGIALDYRFDSLGVCYWLGGVLIVSVLAAWWPVRLATRMTIKSALE